MQRIVHKESEGGGERGKLAGDGAKFTFICPLMTQEEANKFVKQRQEYISWGRAVV